MHRNRRTSGLLFLVAAGAVAWSAGALMAAETADVDYRADIPYATVAGEELKLDLATPRGLEHAVPAIVVIHGGGFSAGKRQDMTGLARRAAAHGYVAATISYRLTPKHRFPAQIEDVKCAVRYLRAHADALKIDRGQIGAMGISAGAYLSMMLGLLDSADGMEGDGGNPEQASKVQAVVSFVGPVNFLRPSYSPAGEQVLEKYFGAKPQEKQEECRRSSPITYVNQGDPPMLLFFGTKDPLVDVDHAYQIAEAMTKAQVPGRVELIVGAGHGWFGAEMERTVDASLSFFDQNLKR
jgi:acetyl esterase/lipase